ncbi:diguanylate cyclase [Xylanibacillus composti]|uniref:Diguanylate cyclase n=2 Tax=Xylanibacillus composti TaxID=1572762 RepID=A0A8J4M2S1_9BACL|nr:diguanylate cyclase [Xylanibacillus composti]MDT9726029.1 diguanylate cyclase [Xylanibacillus composti]GIQ68826.1 hypothetical protein XYCOK13_16500 [Xylanibacillus composti]
MMMARYTIGVYAPVLDGFYFSSMLDGLFAASLRHGMQMVTLQSWPEFCERESYDLMVATACADAFVVIGEAVPRGFMERLQQMGKPVVCIGTSWLQAAKDCATVLAHNELSAKEMVLHLAGHGHERIAFVGGLHNSDVFERFRGYQQALRELGMPYREELVYWGQTVMKSDGRKAGEQIAAEQVPMTAIVAGNDLLAAGVLEALTEAGIAVPDRVALSGYDDSEIALVSKPPLTTVRQKYAVMGNKAVTLLFDRLQNGVELKGVHRIPAELVLRCSCGCGALDESKSQELEGGLYHGPMRDFTSNLYNIGMALNHSVLSISTSTDRFLSWLDQTPYHTGCLVLLDRQEGGSNEVIVHDVYGSRLSRQWIGCRLAEELFPMNELLQCGSAEERDMITLHPLQTPSGFIGCLALIGPFNKQLSSLTYDFMRININVMAISVGRARLREQMEESEAKYRDIFIRTPVMIFMADRDMVMRDVNPYTLDQLDYKEEELVGASIGSIMSSDSYARMKAKVAEALGGKQIVENVEVKLFRKDGTALYGLLNANAMSLSERPDPTVYITIRDITERKAHEEVMRQLAYSDPLTGLANRLRIYDFLNQAIAEAADGEGVAVFFIDLDRFKAVNDTYGHDTGDLYLRHVAGLLASCTTANDLAARLGGDEFIVVMTGIQEARQVRQMTDKISASLAVPYLHHEQEIPVRASIGTSLFPDDAREAEALIQRADRVMYQVKQTEDARR